MKDIKLIKELNENIREKDEFEKALEEAGIEFDLGNGETEEMPDVNGNGEEDFTMGTDEELERIADYWREEGADMDDEHLRDAIGDELEQLDYDSEQISAGIDKVMNLLGRGEENGDEDFDDEAYDYAERLEVGADEDFDERM